MGVDDLSTASLGPSPPDVQAVLIDDAVLALSLIGLVVDGRIFFLFSQDMLLWSSLVVVVLGSICVKRWFSIVTFKSTCLGAALELVAYQMRA